MKKGRKTTGRGSGEREKKKEKKKRRRMKKKKKEKKKWDKGPSQRKYWIYERTHETK